MRKRHESVCVLVFCVLGISRADDVFSRSTAKVFDGTSPRPTYEHRRIYVQQNSGESTVPSLDLFLTTVKEMRRKMGRSNPWSWDYWCHLQPKTGTCSRNVARYYYDAQLDRCTKFSYTGCQGNKNRFNSIVECERYCKGATYTSVNRIENLDFCSVQPDVGMCWAMFDKYYYDVNENNCKTFLYGGCGGNLNRFDTKRDCLSKCRQEDDGISEE